MYRITCIVLNTLYPTNLFLLTPIYLFKILTELYLHNILF